MLWEAKRLPYSLTDSNLSLFSNPLDKDCMNCYTNRTNTVATGNREGSRKDHEKEDESGRAGRTGDRGGRNRRAEAAQRKQKYESK